HADVITDADLPVLRRVHQANGSRATIFLVPVADPRAYGLVETDAAGRLLRFREKPTADEPITTNMINAGIYLVDAELLRRMPAGRAGSTGREVFPPRIAAGVPACRFATPAYRARTPSPGHPPTA